MKTGAVLQTTTKIPTLAARLADENYAKTV